jgi:hypothetical protein
METNNFTRRQALQATAVLGTALLLPVNNINAASLPPDKTPPLTADEMAAIDAALGKKGSYKEAEAGLYNPIATQRPEDEDQGRVRTDPFWFRWLGIV